ncbi:hypothetical protein H9P43_005333 [Blastocladiella emersonii ATCC 22665]|nr:hypothetical protein H9P43_005333 [Blastocladiella emersonii ATCC 22665]
MSAMIIPSSSSASASAFAVAGQRSASAAAFVPAAPAPAFSAISIPSAAAAPQPSLLHSHPVAAPLSSSASPLLRYVNHAAARLGSATVLVNVGDVVLAAPIGASSPLAGGGALEYAAVRALLVDAHGGIWLRRQVLACRIHGDRIHFFPGALSSRWEPLSVVARIVYSAKGAATVAATAAAVAAAAAAASVSSSKVVPAAVPTPFTPRHHGHVTRPRHARVTPYARPAAVAAATAARRSAINDSTAAAAYATPSPSPSPCLPQRLAVASPTTFLSAVPALSLSSASPLLAPAAFTFSATKDAITIAASPAAEPAAGVHPMTPPPLFLPESAFDEDMHRASPAYVLSASAAAAAASVPSPASSTAGDFDEADPLSAAQCLVALSRSC